MPTSFAKFLLGRDRLGHPFSLNYCGSDTHKTWLGSILSIGIIVLVLIVLAQKSIEMVYMTDPDL